MRPRSIFLVLYKKVEFDIELLFEGAPELEMVVVEAAKELEAEGVRAIVGACGYFAHFQKQVADAVNVPVFLSSLCQLPLIKLGLEARAEDRGVRRERRQYRR